MTYDAFPAKYAQYDKNKKILKNAITHQDF